MKTSIFRRLLCMTIAAAMIFTGTVVLPVGEQYAYAVGEEKDEYKGDTEFGGGDGSKDKPYLIKTIDHLRNIKYHLKDAYYYRLDENLDFDKIELLDENGKKVLNDNKEPKTATYEEVYGDEWVAIGTDPDYFPFQGTFDGNGKTISNLNFTSGATAGLFGYCAGTIKNLKVEDFHISTTGQSAGALVGELCSGGRIEQCAVEGGRIASAHNVGGMVGAAWKGSTISNVYVDSVSIGLDYIYQANQAEDALLGGTDGLSFGNHTMGYINSIFGTVETIGGTFDVLATVFGDNNKWGKFASGAKNYINSLNNKLTELRRTATIGGVVGFLGGDVKYSWARFNSSFWNSLSAGYLEGFVSPYLGLVAGRSFYGSEVNCLGVINNGNVWENIRKWSSGGNSPGVMLGQLYNIACGRLFKPVNSGAKGGDIDINGIWSKIAETQTDDSVIAFPRLSVFIDKDAKDANGDSLRNGNYNSSATASICNSAVEPKEGADGVYKISTPFELAYIEYAGWNDYRLMNDIYLEDCGDPTHYKCTLDKQKTIGTVTVERKEEPLYQRNCVDWGYWTPLCRERDQYFDGNFYGDGHTIYGLNVATNQEGGLFGFILGDVMDLNLVVTQVDAYASAGGLAAGVFYPGNIYRCSVTGKTGSSMVNGGGNADGSGVGGLVGIVGKDVTIQDCYSRIGVSNANWIRRYQYDIWKYIYKGLGIATEIASTANDLKVANEEYHKNEIRRENMLYGDSVEVLLESLAEYERDLDMEYYQLEGELDKNKAELDSIEEKLGSAEKKYQDAQAEYAKALDDYVANDSEENKRKCDDAIEKCEKAEETRDDLSTKKTRLENKVNRTTTKMEEIDAKSNGLKKKGTELQDKQRKAIEELSESSRKARRVAEISDSIKAILEPVKSIGNVGFDYAIAAYENRLGGLVGDCRGKLINCYSAGKVNSSNWGLCFDFQGGLVGRVRNGDSWFSSDGKIMGISEMVQNCYYSANAGYGGAGTSLSQGDMVKKDSYIGFDFITVWAIDSNINGGLPYLNYDAYKAQAEKDAENKAAVLGFAGGDGSEKNPFKIETVEQFTLISNFWYRDYYYELNNDLAIELRNDSLVDSNGNKYYEGDYFKDVATNKIYYLGHFLKAPKDDSDSFRGHFNGKGHKISIVPIERTTGWFNDVKVTPGYSWGSFGLFPNVSGSIRNLEISGLKGYDGGSQERYNWNAGILCCELLPGGCIENIKITDCDVTGLVHIGALAAYVAEGASVRNILIENVNVYRDNYSYVEGSASSKYYDGDVAGLVVGRNSGTVEDVVIFNSQIRGSNNTKQAAIHDNLGTAKRIYINAPLPLADNCSEYHPRTYGEFGTHHYYPGDYFAAGKFGSETTFNGLDFNNTWIINNEALKLRCIRTTTVPDYEGMLSLDNIQGEGTKDKPFIIDSVQDLIKVESKMTDARGFRGVYFKQKADINISSQAFWRYIGSVEMPFGGNYDGNGFTITIGDKAPFGILDGAVVKNLYVKVKGSGNRGYFHGEKTYFGYLAQKAVNSLFMNCNVTRDKTGNGNGSAELSYCDNGFNYCGTFAGFSENTSFINCYSDVEIFGVITAPSETKGTFAGGITGWFDYNENTYNGDIVGLPDTMASVIANCVYKNDFTAKSGKQKCNTLEGYSPDRIDELLINNSYIISGENVNNLVNNLNNTEFVSDKLMERFYNWSIDENGILSLRPGICNVSINTSRDGISIVKAYKVLVQDSKETWEEIELEEPVRTLELSVKNGTRILLEVSFDADNVDKEKIRWELRDCTGRYVQKDDSGVELKNENVIEFSAERNLTVSIYDTRDRVADSLLVALPNNDITVSQYEPLTAENLQKKGVEFGKGYNYGYSDVISPTDSALNITPSYFENTGEDQEVTVTYTIDGNDVQKKFKVNVIPREMSGISVDTTAVAGTLDIEAYESISAAALHELGVRLYKTYNYGSPEDFNRADYGNITVIPNSIGTVGNNQQITLSYVSGEKTFAGSLNVNITDRTVSKIEVKNRPTKLQYVEGQSPEVSDLSGGIITVFYANGPNDVIEMTPESGVTIENYNTGTVGTGSVTVKYGGKTASYNVEVVEKDVVSIEVGQNPSKTKYLIGEELDLTGGIVTFKYDNGTTASVSMKNESFILDEFDSSTTGAKIVSLRYLNRKGQSMITQFTVTVTDTANFNTSASGFVMRGEPNNVQSSSLGMLVKSNGTGDKTRKAYIKFDLSQLKNQLAAAGLEIESAKLIYNARVDREGISKTVHLKEAEEKAWTKETLKWSDAPVDGTLIKSSTIIGMNFTKNTIDVTDYIDRRLLSGSTATFAFDVGTCNYECIIVADSNSIAPMLEIKLRKTTTISPSNSLTVRYNMGVQAKENNLTIKNNGDKNTYSRRGYVQYDLATVKEQIRLGNKTVKKAELIYYASTGKGSWNLQLRKVTSEKNNLDTREWSSTSSQNTAPGLGDVLNTQTINSSTPRRISVDVTDYVKSRINGNTVTFGFTVNQTSQGSSVIIPVVGNNAVKLVITLE